MKIKTIIDLVTKLHSGQKYGFAPFIVHPLLVMRHFNDPTLQVIALFHDVVEDTEYTLGDVNTLFGPEVTSAVDALTRRENEPYLEAYIPRVAENKMATLVKIADLEENLYSATYCYPGEYDNLVPRYKKALEFLHKKCYFDITNGQK
jgi:(p)ppGpp synthase/HD superfamily hydrolase